MKPLTSYTCKLNDDQAAALEAWVREHRLKMREVPYARFAGESDKFNLVFYQSGKLVVQGKGTQEFIEFVLEPEILKQARLGYEAVLNPDLLLPRLGVDESGKGDFFGPLCVAGAYVNESDLGRVQTGQVVSVSNDSHPGKHYEGRISFIADKAEFTPKSVETHAERVNLVYRIKIDITNAEHQLVPGMPADARIALHAAGA